MLSCKLKLIGTLQFHLGYAERKINHTRDRIEIKKICVECENLQGFETIFINKFVLYCLNRVLSTKIPPGHVIYFSYNFKTLIDLNALNIS